jgi:hypothetical protein
MVGIIDLDILSAWQHATGQTAAAEPNETPEPTGHTPPPLIADGLSPSSPAAAGPVGISMDRIS